MDDLIASRSVERGFGAAAEAKSFGVIPALVWAFRIHENGSAEVLSADQPIEDHRDGWLWLHLNLADARSLPWLNKLQLPATALALLRARSAHQQLHANSDCVYGVFSDLVRDIEKSIDQTANLHFIMTERLLISGRHHALSAIEAARQEISCGARQLPNVAALLELIVERVVDAVDGFADDLNAQIDAIEDGLITDRVGDERQRFSQLRRTSVRLHRHLSGLRTLFHRLEREGVERKPALRVAAGRLAQRLDALDHDVVEMRDRARLLQDEISAKMVEETNGHLRVLSILTMLFLPPTLITGVFGMNTKGLPFADDQNAFLYAMSLLLVSSIAVV